MEISGPGLAGGGGRGRALGARIGGVCAAANGITAIALPHCNIGGDLARGVSAILQPA